jgi:hypothetical protein
MVTVLNVQVKRRLSSMLEGAGVRSLNEVEGVLLVLLGRLSVLLLLIFC